MPSVMVGQVCMEKTPGYFHEAPVPQRIFQTNNATKLVLIVRNPVDRLVSDYNQFRSRKLDRGESYPSLEEFLFTSSGNIDIGYQPLQRSIYHYHLVRWMRYFPLSQIHIVDGDRFIKEPWVGLKNLEKFLGISHEITEENFFFNATKGFLLRPSRDDRSKSVSSRVDMHQTDMSEQVQGKTKASSSARNLRKALQVF